MRTLILTCNTGEGHNSSAVAIREVFENNGEFCELLDSLQFVSKRFSKIIGKGHASIYRHSPKLFDKGYSMSEKHSSFFSQGTVLYKLLTRGVEKLYQYITENEIDFIVCVHPFSGILVTELRKKYDINIHTSIVATDYTCVPGTSSTRMDTYFIPHIKLTDDFVSCGIAREKIVVSGIPVKHAFYDAYDKADSRKLLGLPLEKKILVICGGSMGCGPMEEIAEKICASTDDNTLMIVICGNNKKLYSKLMHKQSEKFYVIDYTKRMCDYMRSADVFITKSGGISITEASVLNKPMIFINAVAGCELRNKQFFEKMDCAFTVKLNSDIPKIAVALLKDNALQRRFADNLKNNISKNAAEIIYNTLSDKSKTFSSRG